MGGPRDGSILGQCKVSAPLVIIREVAPKVALQRALVPDNDMIEALAPDGADHAFNTWILPGRTRRRQHFFDAHLLRSPSTIPTVDRVTIPDYESRGGVPRPCRAQLLRVHAVGCAVTFTWTTRRRS